MTILTASPVADWLVYRTSPRKPRYVLPAGAVDAHCHVFGPASRFPYAPVLEGLIMRPESQR